MTARARTTPQRHFSQSTCLRDKPQPVLTTPFASALASFELEEAVMAGLLALGLGVIGMCPGKEFSVVRGVDGDADA